MSREQDPDVAEAADALQARYPTRELVLEFLRQACPTEAVLFRGTSASEASLYGSIARLIVSLGVPLPDPENAAVGTAGDPPRGGNKETLSAGVVRIPAHFDFFQACAHELASSSSLRATFVGPTFLEPTWWHERGPIAAVDDFTQVLSTRLIERSLPTCEVILRNNHDRYSANLAEYVRDLEEWRALLDEMLETSFRLFGQHGELGPRVRCFDPGYAHPPHIFDRCVLIGTRRSSRERVSGGWRITRRDLMALEREKWASMFEQADHDQSDAVDQVRLFLEALRDAFPGRA